MVDLRFRSCARSPSPTPIEDEGEFEDFRRLLSSVVDGLARRSESWSRPPRRDAFRNPSKNITSRHGKDGGGTTRAC